TASHPSVPASRGFHPRSTYITLASTRVHKQLRRDLGDFIFLGPDPARSGVRIRSMTWGGARPNAGRPAHGPVPSEPHKRRPVLSPHHPVRVTARIAGALRALTRRHVYRALHRAL